HLYAREDDLLIDTGDVPGASVRDILELFIITEDVQVKDITPGFVHLTLQGQQASQNARELFGVTFADMKPLQLKMLWLTMIVNRERTGQLGYDLLIQSGEWVEVC